jgi:hypothetical protein
MAISAFFKKYPYLSMNETNQNYQAILMSDISGNWAPTPPNQSGAAIVEAEENVINCSIRQPAKLLPASKDSRDEKNNKAPAHPARQPQRRAEY